MCNTLIELSHHKQSGFYLRNLNELVEVIEQLKASNVALDLVSKLKVHFPATYPKANMELLSTNISTKSLASALKGKILLIPIGVSCVLIFTGLYFTFNVIARDAISENNQAQGWRHKISEDEMCTHIGLPGGITGLTPFAP